MRAPLHHIVVMCMLIATRDTHDTCEPHINLDSFTVNAAR